MKVKDLVGVLPDYASLKSIISIDRLGASIRQHRACATFMAISSGRIVMIVSILKGRKRSIHIVTLMAAQRMFR